MWALIRQNPKFFFLALVMHGLLLSLLFISNPFKQEINPKDKPVVIVQARLVDQAKINAEKARIQSVKDKITQAKKAKRLKIQRERDKVEALRQEKIAKKKALKKKALEKKKALAKKRKKEKEAKKKKALEKKKAQKKKDVEQERKRKAKVLKEKKAKEAKKKQLEEKKLADEKKKKVLEKKRKALQKKRQKELDSLRESELLREQRAEAERFAREQELQKEFNQMEIENYSPLIHDKVRDNWVFAGESAGLSCTLIVRLATGGLVLDVKLSETSGNRAFDRSAIAAVLKAETLPVPSGDIFNRSFREIEIIFAP